MKTYTSTEIQNITGFSQIQIIHLVQRGVINPYVDSTGRGHRRAYSWENLIEFLICKSLSAFNMDTHIMAAVIEQLNQGSFWENMIENLKTPYLTLIPVQGEWGWSFHDYKTIEGHLKNHRAATMLIIDMQNIIKEAQKHV